MSTLLIRTNGIAFANIPDRLVLGPNTNNKFKAPLNLIGQSHISYGKAQNENYLWLVENFASTSAPINVKGQRWYKPQAGFGGEYLLSPTDRANDSDWITIPVIPSVPSEPIAAASYEGRMIIANNSELKMVINKSWSTIPTAVSGDKYYSELIDIRYDTSDGAIISVPNPSYNVNEPVTISEKSMFHPASTWVDVGRFNYGGIYDGDLDIVVSVNTLQYGGTYAWHAEVIARDVIDEQKHRAWSLSGVITVLSSADQTTELAAMDLLPSYDDLYLHSDPRLLAESFLDRSISETEEEKIARYNLNIIKHTESQTLGTEDWDIQLNPIQDFRLETDVIGNVSELIADADIYGLMFQGLAASNTNIQWNIAFTIQGVPNEVV